MKVTLSQFDEIIVYWWPMERVGEQASDGEARFTGRRDDRRLRKRMSFATPTF